MKCTVMLKTWFCWFGTEFILILFGNSFFFLILRQQTRTNIKPTDVNSSEKKKVLLKSWGPSSKVSSPPSQAVDIFS